MILHTFCFNHGTCFCFYFLTLANFVQNSLVANLWRFVQARISQDTEHFLLNPFGMLYNEITASSLVKVNMQVREVKQYSTPCRSMS